jgi:hypothetical protein
MVVQVGSRPKHLFSNARGRVAFDDTLTLQYRTGEGTTPIRYSGLLRREEPYRGQAGIPGRQHLRRFESKGYAETRVPAPCVLAIGLDRLSLLRERWPILGKSLRIRSGASGTC